MILKATYIGLGPSFGDYKVILFRTQGELNDEKLIEVRESRSFGVIYNPENSLRFAAAMIKYHLLNVIPKERYEIIDDRDVVNLGTTWYPGIEKGAPEFINDYSTFEIELPKPRLGYKLD